MENIVEKIVEVCREKNIPVSKLEKDLGYGNGYLNPKKVSDMKVSRLFEILDYLEISYFEFANIGLPETQKAETELVKLRLHSPKEYEEYMEKARKSYEEYKKILATQSDEHDPDIDVSVENASEKQKELIQEVLRLPEEQVSAFLSLAKSLPGDQAVQDDSE